MSVCQDNCEGGICNPLHSLHKAFAKYLPIDEEEIKVKRDKWGGRLCKKDGCEKQPTYGTEWGKAIYCKDHATDGMEDVKSKRCKEDGCKTRPTYGMEWGKAIYCKDHAKEGMENVVSKRCREDGCEKQPNYGTEWGKAIYCKDHATDGMEDVKSKRCKEDGCKTIPTYGTEWGKAIYCKDHATDGMEDVKSKRCKEDGCKTIPNYGTEWGKALYCKNHAKEGMMDVKSKRCEEDGCETQSSYGTEWGKAIYCKDHAKEGMENVKNKRCREDGCETQSRYGTEWGKALYCKNHAKEGMMDVKSKRCLLCPVYVSNKIYKGYCYGCFIQMFPDSPIVRNHKTKERAVADYIREQFPEYTITFDKSIQGGCSLKKPDIFMDFGEYVLIIEIDENQHKTYDCSCENSRPMTLFQDAGNRPLAMIRFNPDKYYDIQGKSIASCWSYTKDKGLCVVKDDKKKEWQQRLQTLHNAIQLQMTYTGERKEVDVIHLFYDENL